MGTDSKIEWTHHTMNFWIGCLKVSDGCDNCYAETEQDTRYQRVAWGGPRHRTGKQVWAKPFAWNKAARASGVRQRVFCMSLGDFFDNQVPEEWRIEAWSVIRQCRHLDWLILTKRPQNVRKMLPPDWGDGWSHVWLGVSVENMTEARRRIPVLLRIPAFRRWLSCEPLLGPLYLRSWMRQGWIEWLICGGETGKNARDMKAEWARSLRDQCADAEIAFFLKQMTKRATIPDDLLVRQYP